MFNHLKGLIAPLQERLSEAAAADDSEVIMDSLLYLGKVYDRLGRFDDALEVLEQARGVADALEDQPRLLRVLNRLGSVQRRRKQYDEAIGILQMARSLAETLDDQYQIAFALNGMGCTLRAQGWVDEAIEILEQSHTLLAELDVPGGQSAVLSHIACIYQLQGRAQEAQQMFQASLELAEPLSDRRYLANAYSEMGDAFLQSADAEQAVVALSEAFSLHQQTADAQGLCITARALIRAYRALNRDHEARDCRQRALALQVPPAFLTEAAA